MRSTGDLLDEETRAALEDASARLSEPLPVVADAENGNLLHFPRESDNWVNLANSEKLRTRLKSRGLSGRLHLPPQLKSKLPSRDAWGFPRMPSTVTMPVCPTLSCDAARTELQGCQSSFAFRGTELEGQYRFRQPGLISMVESRYEQQMKDVRQVLDQQHVAIVQSWGGDGLRSELGDAQRRMSQLDAKFHAATNHLLRAQVADAAAREEAL